MTLLLAALAACAAVAPSPPSRLVAGFSVPKARGELFDSPCKDAEVIRRTPRLYRHELMAASGSYEGRAYGVCWIWSPGKSAAVLFWDDGGAFAVPRELLRFPTQAAAGI